MKPFALAALAATAFALLPRAAAAQAAPELAGSEWVNSGELSLERLRGKVVVLYFFEEG